MARAHSPVEDVIRTRVEEHPDAVWLKFRDETYTWSEVLSNIQRAANGLLDLGVRPGERVAILMGNRPEFIWVHLGILFIGGLERAREHLPARRHSSSTSSPTPTPSRWSSRRSSGMPYSRCGPASPACDAPSWPTERRVTASMGLRPAHGRADAEPEVELAEETSVGGVGMMYTSGTTGTAEGRRRHEVRQQPDAADPGRLRREAGGDDVHVAAALPRQRAARLHDRLDDPRREVRPRRTLQRLALLRRLPQVRRGRVQHPRRA